MSKFVVYLLTFCGGIAATVPPTINAHLAGVGLLAAGVFLILRR